MWTTGRLVLAALLAAACPDGFDIPGAARDIAERYGVEVVYEIGPDFLPAAWHDPLFQASATPIARRELARTLRLLPSWLDKYPPDVLRGNLESVRLCRTLEILGASYGGSTYENKIFLPNEGRAQGFDDRWLELTFHHELSSIFMRNYVFPEEEWLAANPPEVSYATETPEILRAIEEEREAEVDQSLFSIGLLAEYGGSTLENDVNTYAELVFTEPERMKELIRSYPIVHAKYSILKSFYLSIDGGFEPRFADIG